MWQIIERLELQFYQKSLHVSKGDCHNQQHETRGMEKHSGYILLDIIEAQKEQLMIYNIRLVYSFVGDHNVLFCMCF